jgi:3-deoxy-7-phosphoheptulonate synthase
VNYTIIRSLPPVDEILAAYPLSPGAAQRIARHQEEIRAILAGQDDRMLVVVGPCSAWPSEAVLAYAERLGNLADEVASRLKLVLRVYIQKPRTRKGWTGPVNQPDPFAGPDIEKGIAYARSLMVRTVEMGLPIADEAVFTHNARGFIELLSWVAIGARSTEDQEHRIFASAVGCPVGLKNPTSGDIAIGVNSVVAAQHPHTAVLDTNLVETPGNPFAHLVLRGGIQGPNYRPEHLLRTKEILELHKVQNPGVIVDASHDNCTWNGMKDPLRQPFVVREVMQALEEFPALRTVVKGFMLESFLKAGCQVVESTTPDAIDRGGLSITDPCLGWDETAATLRRLARTLSGTG